MSAEIRIDRTNALQVLTEKFAAQNLPLFLKGEGLIARVITARGNQVTLKTQDGRLFSANLLADMQLSEGEDVDLVVRENAGGRIVLQLLTAGKAPASSKSSFNPAQFNNEGNTDAITEMFRQLDIKPTSAKIQNVLNIIKEYPSLNEKAAVFFSANNIPVNKQNVDAIMQLAEKENKIGENLLKILGNIVETESQQQNVGGNAKTIGYVNDPAVYSGNNQTQKSDFNKAQDMVKEKAGAIKAGQDIPASSDKDTLLQPVKNEDAGFIKDSKIMLDKNGQPYIMKDETAQPFIVKNENSQVKTALWPKIEDAVDLKAMPSAEVALSEETIMQNAVANNPKALFSSGDIVSKILAMFANLDEKGKGELKKVSSGTLKELDVLAEMVRHSDIKSRDDFSFRLSELVSREKLSSDINRYICLHIPVIINQSVHTAEVYIYKRNKRGKKIDKENTVISLGLDMNYMGRVESVIQVDKKNVSLNFKLENEKAMAIVKESTTKLFKALQSIGYKLADTKVTKLTQKTTVIDAEEELNRTVNKEKVTIDYKI